MDNLKNADDTAPKCALCGSEQVEFGSICESETSTYLGTKSENIGVGTMNYHEHLVKTRKGPVLLCLDCVQKRKDSGRKPNTEKSFGGLIGLCLLFVPVIFLLAAGLPMLVVSILKKYSASNKMAFAGMTAAGGLLFALWLFLAARRNKKYQNQKWSLYDFAKAMALEYYNKIIHKDFNPSKQKTPKIRRLCSFRFVDGGIVYFDTEKFVPLIFDVIPLCAAPEQLQRANLIVTDVYSAVLNVTNIARFVYKAYGFGDELYCAVKMDKFLKKLGKSFSPALYGSNADPVAFLGGLQVNGQAPFTVIQKSDDGEYYIFRNYNFDVVPWP